MNTRRGRIAAAALALMLACAAEAAAEPAKSSGKAQTQALWFDPTQLPSFTGVVDRFLPNPGGRVDRLVFKEGPQIVFPPDAFEAIREAAPAGRPLVVWGIRARPAPVITMLAYAPPDAEPIVLDRFYWRPERRAGQGGREMQLTGKVWAPYLSPRGQTEGAILENGDVVRVEPHAAEMLKDRLAVGAKIVAVGKGSENGLGRAIDASKIGETAETLVEIPPPEPAAGSGGGKAGPR